MCEKCKKLLNVPRDKKAKIVLDNSKAIDAKRCETFIEVNHNEDGSSYAFIKTEIEIESTERSYSVLIPIAYCPFCGEQLIK